MQKFNFFIKKIWSLWILFAWVSACAESPIQAPEQSGKKQIEEKQLAHASSRYELDETPVHTVRDSEGRSYVAELQVKMGAWQALSQEKALENLNAPEVTELLKKIKDERLGRKFGENDKKNESAQKNHFLALALKRYDENGDERLGWVEFQNFIFASEQNTRVLSKRATGLDVLTEKLITEFGQDSGLLNLEDFAAALDFVARMKKN